MYPSNTFQVQRLLAWLYQVLFTYVCRSFIRFDISVDLINLLLLLLIIINSNNTEITTIQKCDFCHFNIFQRQNFISVGKFLCQIDFVSVSVK